MLQFEVESKDLTLNLPQGRTEAQIDHPSDGTEVTTFEKKVISAICKG